MGEVDFEMSSQAKCWMFDEISLHKCREQACGNKQQQSTRDSGSTKRVCKFACRYYNRTKAAETSDRKRIQIPTDMSSTISQHDQETLVHFHAHQIQKLIGPNAIFPLLKRRSSVLSTAIMLFRKFYLSNSVIDFHPRNIAAASALLAVKTDCEQNIPIDVLSHATLVVEMRAQNDPLCGDELRAVTIHEIEAGERALMEGCDYRLRCHHPYGAIKVLVSDVASFIMESRENENKNNLINDYPLIDNSMGSVATDNNNKNCDYGYTSPRSVMYEHQPYHHDDDHADHHHLGLSTLCERALSVAQSSLVYSDINFLFPPGQIAFAAVALALDGHTSTHKNRSTTTCNRLGTKMRDYLCSRFSQKSSNELLEYEKQVSKIITNLEKCPAIDLEMFSPFWQYHQRRYARTAERQAIEIRRAIFTASRLRVTTGTVLRTTAAFVPTSPPPLGYHQLHYQHHYHHYKQQCHYEESRRKRLRAGEEEDTWTRPHHKIARVTPINTPFI